MSHDTDQSTGEHAIVSVGKSPGTDSEGRLESAEDFVFTTKHRNSTRASQRHQTISEASGDCKVPRHRFPDLVHTASTLSVVQGVHSKAIQSVLGWDTAAKVDLYAHFVDELQKDAATKMDAILKPWRGAN